MPSRDSAPTPTLGVEALTVQRSGRTLVDRVSFAVEPGELIALIGANGAGKTTLLEALVGVQPARGRVRYRGRELRSLRERASVFSFMPDDAEAPPEVRVLELTRYARRFGRVADERAEELFARLGLSAMSSARAGELSRGEKRRLGLFCALCSDRPVIVLDEPLGAFDPLQRIAVLDVLRDSARAGSALVFSVHQMSDAEKIAGRVLILHAGRLLAADSVAALRARVARPTASLEEIFLHLLEAQHVRS